MTTEVYRDRVSCKRCGNVAENRYIPGWAEILITNEGFMYLCPQCLSRAVEPADKGDKLWMTSIRCTVQFVLRADINGTDARAAVVEAINAAFIKLKASHDDSSVSSQVLEVVDL